MNPHTIRCFPTHLRVHSHHVRAHQLLRLDRRLLEGACGTRKQSSSFETHTDKGKPAVGTRRKGILRL